jgi:esterase/lipase superfamily enzyme
MPETIAERIEKGEVQLFCVDSIDKETWSGSEDHKPLRSYLQELWYRHIVEEFLPVLQEINGTRLAPITTGCSMGATHALNFFLRRPDLFDGVIALSGAYDARYFFGDDFMDDTLYMNSIVDYMANLPLDHDYIPMFNARNIVLCTGQGAWEEEMVRTTRIMKDIFAAKGIRATVDFWGYDVAHDWPWWFKMVAHYVPQLLY